MFNIAKSFKDWMIANSIGTDATIFIGGAPVESPDACYYIIASGGSPVKRNVTGGRQKNYLIEVYYRDIDEEKVYDTMQALELLLNGKEDIELENFTTIEVSAVVFPVDQDLDNNDRSIGSLHANILAYQTE